MMFIENTRFRGRIWHPDTRTCNYHAWRDTVAEVMIDLGIDHPEQVKGQPPVQRIQRTPNGFDYIENERGFVAIPGRV